MKLSSLQAATKFTRGTGKQLLQPVAADPAAFVAGVYAAALLVERAFPWLAGRRMPGRAGPARAALVAVIALVTIVLVPQTVSRFIYFQF